MNNQFRHLLSDRLRWAAFIIAFLTTLWVQWSRLVDPYQIEEDFRSLFWMHRFTDPTLFLNDPQVFDRITDVAIGPVILIVDIGSIGFSLLYQAADHFVPFILFSKLLIFPLTLISVAYIYEIGKKIKGAHIGFTLSLLFMIIDLASPTAVSTTGGLQRSFLFPILLGMVYHLMNRHDKRAAALMILGSLFYPPVFILCTAMYALSLIEKKKNRKVQINWPRLKPFLMACLFSLLVLLPVVSQQLGFVGPSASYQSAVAETPEAEPVHMLQDPARQPGNPRAIFDVFPIVGRGGIATPGLSVLHIILFSVFAIIIAAIVPQSLTAIPPALRRLFWASWLCFGLSWLAIVVTSSYLLYMPSRYTEASLVLFLLIYVGAFGQDAMEKMARFFFNQKYAGLWLTIPLGLLIGGAGIYLTTQANTPGLVEPRDFGPIFIFLAGLMLIFTAILSRRPAKQYEPTKAPNILAPQWQFLLGLAAYILGLVYVFAFQADFYRATPADRALFSYLQNLPPDVMLAGDARILSSVSMFSQRRVFHRCETPELIGLEAYYAHSDHATDVAAFCAEFDIDYFIVDARSFAANTREERYCRMPPRDAQLKAQIAKTTHFYWADAAAANHVFEQDYLSVVACPTQETDVD